MPKHRSAPAHVEPPPETPVSAEPAPSAEPALPPASIVNDVLKLKHDYESKRETAIAELLKERTAIEKQFNEKRTEIERHLEELGYVREPDWVPVPASRVQPFRSRPAR
jgi:hypothetical protein